MKIVRDDRRLYEISDWVSDQFSSLMLKTQEWRVLNKNVLLWGAVAGRGVAVSRRSRALVRSVVYDVVHILYVDT